MKTGHILAGLGLAVGVHSTPVIHQATRFVSTIGPLFLLLQPHLISNKNCLSTLSSDLATRKLTHYDIC